MQLIQHFAQCSYGSTRLGNLKAYGMQSASTGNVTITGIEIDGQLSVPSPCFWKSLLNQFCVSKSTLRLFGTNNILERLKQWSPDTVIRYRIERDAFDDTTIMAVSNRPAHQKRFDHRARCKTCDRQQTLPQPLT